MEKRLDSDSAIPPCEIIRLYAGDDTFADSRLGMKNRRVPQERGEERPEEEGRTTYGDATCARDEFEAAAS